MSNNSRILFSILFPFLLFLIGLIAYHTGHFKIGLEFFNLFDSSLKSCLMIIGYLGLSWLLFLLTEISIIHAYPVIVSCLGIYHSINIYIIMMAINCYKETFSFAIAFFLLIRKWFDGTGMSEPIWSNVLKEFYKSVGRMEMLVAKVSFILVFNSLICIVLYSFDQISVRWRMKMTLSFFTSVNLIVIYLIYNLLSIMIRASWIHKFALKYKLDTTIIKGPNLDIQLVTVALIFTVIMWIFSLGQVSDYQFAEKGYSTLLLILLNSLIIAPRLLITNIIDSIGVQVFCKNEQLRIVDTTKIFNSRVIHHYISVICIYMTVVCSAILYSFEKIRSMHNLILIVNIVFLNGHLIMEPLLGWITFMDIFINTQRRVVMERMPWIRIYFPNQPALVEQV